MGGDGSAVKAFTLFNSASLSLMPRADRAGSCCGRTGKIIWRRKDLLWLKVWGGLSQGILGPISPGLLVTEHSWGFLTVIRKHRESRRKGPRTRCCFRVHTVGAAGCQWLRVLSVYPENLNLVSNTHIGWLETTCNSSSKGPDPLF